MVMGTVPHDKRLQGYVGTTIKFLNYGYQFG